MSTDKAPQITPSVIEMIAENENRDSRLMRWSMGVAVALHVMFFVLNWNFLAFGGEGPNDEVRKQRIFVIKHVKFSPPPKQELPDLRKPQARRVQIPDSDPWDPEPVRVESLEDSEIVIDTERVIGFPEAPPMEPVGTIRFQKGGELTEPVKIGGATPAYPEAARQARIQGVVVLECVIGKDGTVQQVTTLRGLPLGLTQSAVEAVTTWTFEPSTLHGKPVEVLYVLTVRFKLA